MAIAFVADVEVQESGVDGTTETTGSVDTTGANMIVVSVLGDGNPGDLDVTDNKSNTYTPLTRQVQDPKFVQLFYVLNPTVGSGHTFTATGDVNIFCAIGVEAFSGVTSFDQQSGAGQASGTSIQPGALTPPADGALFVVAMVSQDNTGGHTPSDFTETADFSETGAAAGGTMAYFIQDTAGARNPGCSVAVGTAKAVRMATFLAAVTSRVAAIQHNYRRRRV